MGWLRGLEPPTTGITIQDSNQLSYSHHGNTSSPNMARPAGIEPATAGLEGRSSIRLSYGRPDRIVAPPRRRSGRGRGIRTPDILLPKQARYQTALYPADGTGHRSLAGSRGAPAQRKAGHCPFRGPRCQRTGTAHEAAATMRATRKWRNW